MDQNFSKTPLAMVMDHLHITAASMSHAIHVDSSLISRWKTGKRDFNSSSAHYNAVIDYILSRDEYLDYMNLSFLIKGYLPDIDIDSTESAAKALDMFLCGVFPRSRHEQKAIPNDGDDHAVLDVIKGAKAIRTALLEFLDLALTFDKNKSIYLIFDKQSDVFFENDWWYRQWTEKLNRLADNGHSIYYIYNNSAAYSNIVNLDNFLHIYQLENFHSYTMRMSDVDSFDLLMIEDSFAITNFSSSSSGQTNRHVVYSTTNPTLIKTMKQSFSNILNISVPLSTSQQETEDRANRMLKGLQQVNQDIILYSSSIFDFPIPSEKFETILHYNGFSKDDRELILNRYNTFICEPFMKDHPASSSVIVNADSFLNHLNWSNFEIYPKLFSEHQVIVPQKYYHYFIEEFLSHLKSPQTSKYDFSISVVSAEERDLPENISVYTIMGYFTYINKYLHEHHDNYVFTNPLFISDFFNYLFDIKENLPDESKTTNRVISLLEQALSDK